LSRQKSATSDPEIIQKSRETSQPLDDDPQLHNSGGILLRKFESPGG
jgi:hypothetical protein